MPQAYALTDQGLQRDHNEDAFWVPEPGHFSPEQLARYGALYLVADGMGGHQAGEVASGLAVRRIPHAFYADPDPDRAQALARAVQQANAEIRQAAREDAHRAKMGATLVAAVLQGQRLHIAHAGDSRAYLWRAGRLRRLTEDHTWVNDRHREGILTAEEVAHHPLRHVITRSLGGDPQLTLEMATYSVQPGDLLLLCSDGLSGEVPEATIGQLLGAQPPAQAAASLIQAANAAGGADNVTVVIVPVEATRGASEVVSLATAVAPPSSRFQLPRLALLLVLILFCVVGGLVLSRSGNLRRFFAPAPTPTFTPTVTPPPTSTLSPWPTPSPTSPPIPVATLPPAYLGAPIPRFPYPELDFAEKFRRFEISVLDLMPEPFRESPSRWRPRRPYGILLEGEVIAKGERIPSEFLSGTAAYTIVLQEGLETGEFEDSSLRDASRWQVRIVGFLEDQQRVQALRVELRLSEAEPWHTVSERVPQKGLTAWFYVQQRVAQGFSAAPAACDHLEAWTIAYLRVESGQSTPTVFGAYCLNGPSLEVP